MHHTASAGPYHALTIAGSDSCGGAGIQADLKTINSLGVEAASVLTAITAQNTACVSAIRTLDRDLVVAQLDAVMEDLPIAAAKTGMLANAELIEGLAERLKQHPQLKLVVDPVIVATSGARLLDPEAERTLLEQLLPLADLVTPNLPEACVLTGSKPGTPVRVLGERLLESGCRAVLIKGGHDQGELAVDWLLTVEDERHFSHPRLPLSVHGTGCALSAAITALLARGHGLEKAVEGGIDWLHRKLSNSWLPKLGKLAMLPLAEPTETLD